MSLMPFGWVEVCWVLAWVGVFCSRWGRSFTVSLDLFGLGFLQIRLESSRASLVDPAEAIPFSTRGRNLNRYTTNAEPIGLWRITRSDTNLLSPHPSCVLEICICDWCFPPIIWLYKTCLRILLWSGRFFLAGFT